MSHEPEQGQLGAEQDGGQRSVITPPIREPSQRRSEHGVDFALFAEVGQVAPNVISKIALDSFQPGFGFGFRLWRKTGLISSLQFGFSDEHARVYLKINPGE